MIVQRRRRGSGCRGSATRRPPAKVFGCVKPRCRSRSASARPSVMGVINVTPDSFSDGGVHLARRARRSRRRGGCSTRARRSSTSAASRRGPGSDGRRRRRRSCARIEPVLADLDGRAGLGRHSKAAVARRALELGVELVNDVTALRGDPELAGVVADAGCYLCLMHMQGEPRTMQVDPRYDDVVSDVKRVPRGAARVRGRGGRARGARLPRPGDRLRQDRRAQLRARPPARRARRDRAAAAGRLLAQELARRSSRATRREDRLGRRVGRRCGRRVRARRDDPARARRARARRGARPRRRRCAG